MATEARKHCRKKNTVSSKYCSVGRSDKAWSSSSIVLVIIVTALYSYGVLYYFLRTSWIFGQVGPRVMGDGDGS